MIRPIASFDFDGTLLDGVCLLILHSFVRSALRRLIDGLRLCRLYFSRRVAYAARPGSSKRFCSGCSHQQCTGARFRSARLYLTHTWPMRAGNG